MDILKRQWKKNLIFKTWDRCRALGAGIKKSTGRNSCDSLTRSKSWHCATRSSSSSSDEEKRKKKCQVAPDGCFSVYVGPQKQRFVIKTEFANHPLFKTLLQDAELEYGFNSEGPILLPCDVDLFYKVLAEMDSGEEISPGCTGYSPLILCSPSRRSIYRINKGCGSYSLLSPSRMIKLNRF